jgi:hypothetical protein
MADPSEPEGHSQQPARAASAATSAQSASAQEPPSGAPTRAVSVGDSHRGSRPAHRRRIMTELMADEKATTKGGVRTDWAGDHSTRRLGHARRAVVGGRRVADAAVHVYRCLCPAGVGTCRSGPARPGCWPSRLLRSSHRRTPRIAEHRLRADPTRHGHRVFLPRLVRPAIRGFLGWSAALWWLSEGLGGLATGHASLITGASGVILLYAVLASAAWPTSDHRSPTSFRQSNGRGMVALGVGHLVDRRCGAANAPQPARRCATRSTAPTVYQGGSRVCITVPRLFSSRGGSAPSITLVAVMALVGLGGLACRPWRMAAAAAGELAAAAFGILGQNIGQLYSGQATDPNTGPHIVLMALALAGTTRSLALTTNTRSPSTPISTAGITNSRR